jgi:hypothetical protein
VLALFLAELGVSEPQIGLLLTLASVAEQLGRRAEAG